MNLRRKRLRLMRDTQWRGYARTAEGNPITLPQIRSVVALSVFGNSSQDGTPSPDNPIEVVGTGTGTGNLYKDADTYIYIKADTPYTILKDPDKLPQHTRQTVYADADDTSDILLNVYGYQNYWGFVFQSSKDGYLRVGGSNSTVWINPADQSIMVYEGKYGDIGNKNYVDNFASIEQGKLINGFNYEPYGYKVAVTASGRNLFDVLQIADTSNIIKDGNNLILTGYACQSNLSPNLLLEITGLKQGDEFTVSRNCEILSGEINSTSGRISFARKDNPQIVFYLSRTYPNTITTGAIPVDFDDNHYDNAIFYGCNKGDIRKLIMSKIQLLKGTYTADTLPPYEPYKSPQLFNVYTPDVLHGVGDAHDTVILDFDRRKAELVQEVNKIVMTGNESIQVYEYPANPSYNGFSSFMLLNGKIYSREEYFSNYFDSSGSNNLWIGVADYVIYFVNSQFYNAEFEDKGLSNFVTSLKQQYDSGNPVTIYYDNSRYEPTTTDITDLQQWDALPQLRGTWILTAAGGTEPTLKAEFYSEERSTE